MQQAIGEIPWHTEVNKYNRVKMIIIERCPECGREGTLQIDKKRSGGRRKYRIQHGDRSCGIGVCHPCWEQLDNIYKKVRHKGTDE